MPTNRILIGVAVAALAAAVWFALSSTGPVAVKADTAGPVASSTGQPILPTTPAPTAPAPSPAAQPAAIQSPPTDAGVQTPTRENWKSRWEGIPLDDSGRSMTGHGQTKAFNRAVQATIREELQRCAATRPNKVEQQVSVELFVEATANGYSIIGAEAPTDAGLDSYTRRCFELAFEAQLEIPDAGTTAGLLYHLSYPLLLPGPPDPEDSAPN